MCTELYGILPDNLLFSHLGPEPPVLHVALDNKNKVLMGTLLHGAQQYNQPFLVGLVSGQHSHTNLACHHGILYPTILKASLFHTGTGVCLRSSHETASPVMFQLQSKLDIVTVLG